MLFNIEISDQLNAAGKALPTGWRKDHDQNDSLLFVFGGIWWTALKNRAWPPCGPVQQQCGEMVQKKNEKSNYCRPSTRKTSISNVERKVNKTNKQKTKDYKIGRKIAPGNYRKFHNHNMSTIFSKLSKRVVGT